MKFFTYYVKRYPRLTGSYKVSFVGSIAYRFRPYLEHAAHDCGVEITTIVQHPMDGLVKYHCITVPESVGDGNR